MADPSMVEATKVDPTVVEPSMVDTAMVEYSMVDTAMVGPTTADLSLTISPLNNIANLEPEYYVLHLHCACLHLFTGDSFSDIELSPVYSGQDEFGNWILSILHPRWCPACLETRRHSIFQNYTQRLLDLADAEGHSEAVRIEHAYVRGVRDGRMTALSRSLLGIWAQFELDGKDREDGSDDGAASEKFGEMIDMMTDMEVGDREPGVVERDEELSDLMRTVSMDGDVLTDDLEMYFEELEAHEEGFIEGLCEQANMELKALAQEDPLQREELYKRALL